MKRIRAKTLKDKINLFIKIADDDGNGLLSKTEVYDLSKICLSKYINDEETLVSLSEYLTKLIFQVTETKLTEEIPLTLLRKKILDGHKDADLLKMFAGADI